jgi:CubicO group peptidase (beta-lactamase class C family)
MRYVPGSRNLAAMLPLAAAVAVWPLWAVMAASPAAAQSVGARQDAAARTVAELAGCDVRLLPVADTIRAVMAEQELPSMAVAVAQGGRIICEAAFGWADRDAGIAATPHTLYSLASISKPFTATAVAVLEEQGLLQLDAPANAYLGTAKLRSFEGDADSATVRRLLTHTAGLPLHYQFFYEGGPPVPSMDEAISRWGIVVYEPGERFVYANFGFGVLDQIVANVAGQPYDEFLHAAVLQPLGLTNTVVSDGAGLGTRAAVRYGSDGAALPPYTFDHVGASGVWSSAHDLVRFGMFHLRRREPGRPAVLSDAGIESMQQQHAPADAPGAARGLGWGLAEDDHGLRRIAHTGSMPGVATALNLYPSEDLAVVVLTNSSHSPSVARVASALTAAVVPSYAAEVAARNAARSATTATAAGTRPAAASAQQAPAFIAPAELVGTWRGAVLLPGGGEAPMVLELQADAAPRVRLGAQTAEVGAARMADGWLTGRFVAVLDGGGADAAPAPQRAQHAIVLNVTQRGERLSGWVSAISTTATLYGAVSYPIELRR